MAEKKLLSGEISSDFGKFTHFTNQSLLFQGKISLLGWILKLLVDYQLILFPFQQYLCTIETYHEWMNEFSHLEASMKKRKQTAVLESSCSLFFSGFFHGGFKLRFCSNLGSIHVVSWFLLSTKRILPLGNLCMPHPDGKGSGEIFISLWIIFPFFSFSITRLSPE